MIWWLACEDSNITWRVTTYVFPTYKMLIFHPQIPKYLVSCYLVRLSVVILQAHCVRKLLDVVPFVCLRKSLWLWHLLQPVAGSFYCQASAAWGLFPNSLLCQEICNIKLVPLTFLCFLFMDIASLPPHLMARWCLQFRGTFRFHASIVSWPQNS